MKTIIVATDYSPTAKNALAYASQLAQHTGVRMVLFHALHLPVPTSEAMVPLSDIQELIKDHKVRLTNIAKEIESTYQVPVEVHCVPSLLLDELEELSSRYEEPVVVVGMRGDSLERKIFGSVTTSIVRNGKYPVLVIPAEARFREIAKIIFACDYHHLSALNPLRPLKELALHFKARIQIFHIEKSPALILPGERIEPRKFPTLEGIFRGIKHSYKEVESEEVIEEIEEGIQEFGADMLVMVPHKKGFWKSFLNGSKTREMTLKTPIPLLALPNPRL